MVARIFFLGAGSKIHDNASIPSDDGKEVRAAKKIAEVIAAAAKAAAEAAESSSETEDQGRPPKSELRGSRVS